jgi:hypothetical protein
LSCVKLGFYEKVVVAKCDDDPSYVGAIGYVLGMSDQTSGEPMSYDVLLDTIDEVVCFSEDEVRGTGEIAPRSQFYDDASKPIRVRVIDGKGYPADDT